MKSLQLLSRKLRPFGSLKSIGFEIPLKRGFGSSNLPGQSQTEAKSAVRDISQVPSLGDFAKIIADSPTEDERKVASSLSEPVFPEDAMSQAEDSLSPGPKLQGKKYYIETYGCQMNEADTEIVRSILNAAGMEVGTTVKDSDVVLINTCSIRENAEKKVFGRLNELKAEKRKLQKKDLMIGVLGCMAERLKAELVEKNKVVDLVVGPDAYRDLPNLLQDLMVV